MTLADVSASALRLNAGNPDFSICVPTRNRSALIGNLVERFGRLAGPSFELIVIDDGSTDDTGDELFRLSQAVTFPFHWERISHAGRGAALNRAFDISSGRFIFILDDDDFIPDNALADILDTWNSIPASEQSGFCGICGLAAYANGAIIGDKFPAEMTDGDFFNVRIVGGIHGDKREVFLRAALGGWRFPQVPGEYRMETNFLFFALAARYKMRFVNRVWLVKNYQPDGLSANILFHQISSARLSALYFETALKLFPKMPQSIRRKYILDYMRYAAHARIRPAARLATIGRSPASLLALARGQIKSASDRRKLRRTGHRS
jgi:glycosyltransferase involved in cell wall biosynthesis